MDVMQMPEAVRKHKKPNQIGIMYLGYSPRGGKGGHGRFDGPTTAPSSPGASRFKLAHPSGCASEPHAPRSIRAGAALSPFAVAVAIVVASWR